MTESKRNRVKLLGELIENAADELNKTEGSLIVEIPTVLATSLIMEIQLARSCADTSPELEEMREQLDLMLYEEIQSKLPPQNQELLTLGWKRLGIKFIVE